MRQPLSERIFKSSFDCTYKCHLLLNGRHGDKSEYEAHTSRADRLYQRAAVAALQKLHPDKATLSLNALTPSSLNNSAQLVVINRVDASGLRSEPVVLVRAKNRDMFDPVLFHRHEEISIRAKLLLAFRASKRLPASHQLTGK